MKISLNAMIDYLDERIPNEINEEYKKELEWIRMNLADWYKSVTYQNFKDKRYSSQDEINKYKNDTNSK